MWSANLRVFLEKEVFSLPFDPDPKAGLFNPYRSTDSELDLEKAAEIRRENLLGYIKSLPERPWLLLVGEAPGWRGCRFSGIPFTSERQLVEGTLPFPGRQSSRKPEAWDERSARIFWNALMPYFPAFFCWNSLPLHPFKPGIPCSNRHPKKSEARKFLSVLYGIWTILQPRQVIGIGRCACWALSEAGVASAYVRHPAHGGSDQFQSGMRTILTASPQVILSAPSRSAKV